MEDDGKSMERSRLTTLSTGEAAAAGASTSDGRCNCTTYGWHQYLKNQPKELYQFSATFHAAQPTSSNVQQINSALASCHPQSFQPQLFTGNRFDGRMLRVETDNVCLVNLEDIDLVTIVRLILEVIVVVLACKELNVVVVDPAAALADFV